MSHRILFVCKQHIDDYGVPIGLVNSARFNANALNKVGIVSEAVSVIDNSFIWKEIEEFNPTHVIIDALWVVPSKFDELLAVYPDIVFIVRLHSKTPFLAAEGIAMDWLYQYNKIQFRNLNFYVSCNNKYLARDLNKLGIITSYLPNIYDPETPKFHKKYNDFLSVDIGCFGALRILKNQLIQAMSAIEFANDRNLILNYHINGNRIESQGKEVYKNLKALFDNNQPHKLIEHPWMEHKDFIRLICNQVDVGLQVSYSESFNIVTADFVWNDVPVVGSKDIDWLPFCAKADPNSVQDIKSKLGRALDYKFLTHYNKKALIKYNKVALEDWLKFLKNFS